MARLFLIRHGEPEAAWGGADDDPGLSESGLEQARAAAASLGQFGPLTVLTSPMRRCLETAAPYVAKVQCDARVEPRVSEVATPAGVSDRRAWISETFPWRDATAQKFWRDAAPELRAWRESVLGAVREINQDTAVFTHFIAINVIAGAAMERDDMIVCKPDYASITEIGVDGDKMHLMRFGAGMRMGEVR